MRIRKSKNQYMHIHDNLAPGPFCLGAEINIILSDIQYYIFIIIVTRSIFWSKMCVRMSFTCGTWATIHITGLLDVSYWKKKQFSRQNTYMKIIIPLKDMRGTETLRNIYPSESALILKTKSTYWIRSHIKTPIKSNGQRVALCVCVWVCFHVASTFNFIRYIKRDVVKSCGGLCEYEVATPCVCTLGMLMQRKSYKCD